jgi:hypothetical protein
MPSHATIPTTKSFKAIWVPRLRSTHKILAWLGALALALWGLSGVLHPLITTFGVQQAVFMPPQVAMNLQDVKPISEILRETDVQQVRAIRVIAGKVVGQSQPLLQVTEETFKPRRYFNLQTGFELPDHDSTHAEYLARHYLKIPDTEPANVEWVDQFSTAYPSVNRLLPVYKVSFDGRDGLHAYIYTETNSIAGVSNTAKQWAQNAFQWFHTWSWLSVAQAHSGAQRGLETARIVMMTCMLLGLIGMGLSGLSMLIMVRRKRRRLALLPSAGSQPSAISTQSINGFQRIHRMAAYLLVLPVLGFAGSGVYHLWVMGWPIPESVIRLPNPLTAKELQAGLQAPLTENWNEWTKGLEVTGLSVVPKPDSREAVNPGAASANTENKAGSSSELYYRLALKLNTTQQGIPILPDEIRHARFTGTPVSGPALYINARTGQPAQMDDKQLALLWGQQYTGLDADYVQQVKLITRFGADYDFRNKRLPVWQIDYRAPFNGSIFVDTSTGVLVDITPDNQKPERWSFNTLHKWNFLTPLGRNTQNLATGLTGLLAVIFLAGLGLRLKLKPRSRS